MLVIYNKIMY